jgi:hypothetical protein
MALEITVTSILSFAKGNILALKRSLQSGQFDVSGTAYIANVQTIGGDVEALALGDVGTCGWMWAKNLDSTSTIGLTMNTSPNDLIDLQPGEVFAGRLAGNTPSAHSTPGSADLEYIIISD